MVKIALFVEGLTELIFIEKLLLEIFGQNNLAVETLKMRGGGKNSISLSVLKTPANLGGKKYYAQIVDCGGENSVKSYILDRRASLIGASFSKIIGVLDVFPNFSRVDIPRYITGLKYRVPTKDIEIIFCLSVMELEAWFLSEHLHFPKIDPSLTVPIINASLGFNPETDNMEDRANPAGDLNTIYQLAGKTYSKDKRKINRTVNNLDYANLYLECIKRTPSLKYFVDEVEKIFA